MKGQKQDKQESREWTRRGMDLENIRKIVNAWSKQMEAAGLETCLKQLRAVLKGYAERCTAESDKR